MKKLLLLSLILALLVGCGSDAERNSPTESEKLLLQCKDNLRELCTRIRYESNRGRRGKTTTSNYPKTLSQLRGTVPTCPAARKDTYSESYDPKTGLIFCKGEHHKIQGVPADYPRVSPVDSKENPLVNESAYAGHVMETPEGTVAMPTGFPLPFTVAPTVLSTSVGRRDGVWHAYLRCEGDLKVLEENWRNLLNDKVYSPSQTRGVNVSGETPLASTLSASLELETGIIRVRYEPAFLVDDLAENQE